MLMICWPGPLSGSPCDTECHAEMSMLPNFMRSLFSPPPHIMDATRVTLQAKAIATTSRYRRLWVGMSFIIVRVVIVGAAIFVHTGVVVGIVGSGGVVGTMLPMSRSSVRSDSV